MRLVATTAAAIFGVSVLTASSPAILGNNLFAISKNTNTNVVTAVAEQTTSVDEAVAPPTPQPKEITVQPGDTLTAIAAANGTTVLRLFYANTNISDPDLIYPNQQLRVPSNDETLTPRAVPVNQQIAQPTDDQSTKAAAPQPAAAPAPAKPSPVDAPTVASGSVWDRLAQCESGGNWAINTGNGFYGGLQFTLSSWAAVGGSGYPNQASREEQIMRAQILQSRQGWGAWPACSGKLGLR